MHIKVYMSKQTYGSIICKMGKEVAELQNKCDINIYHSFVNKVENVKKKKMKNQEINK